MDDRRKDDLEQSTKLLLAHLRSAHAVANTELAGASPDRLAQLHDTEHDGDVDVAHDHNPYATGSDIAEGSPYASGPDHAHRHGQTSP